MKDELGEFYVKIKADVDELNKEIKGLRRDLDNEAKKIERSFTSTFDNIFKKIGGFYLLTKAFDFGRKIVETASQFEQLKMRLTSLYGSAEKATSVFEEFKRIAATTPYDLQGVVEAGATLKAFGLDAETTLKSVTDLAAYMGMDLVEAASSVGRAFAGGVGASEILRERGVLALIRSFSGVEDLTKLTLPEFRRVLLETLVDPVAGIAGATDRLSQTFGGAFSNLMDSLTNKMAEVGSRMIPFLTGLARILTVTKTSLEEATESASQERAEFEQLTFTFLRLKDSVSLTDAQKKLYQDTINKLNEKYPEYFKNINLETDNYAKVKTAIDNARNSLEEYLKLKVRESLLTDKTASLASNISDQIKTELEIDELKRRQAKGEKFTYEVETPTGSVTRESDMSPLIKAAEERLNRFRNEGKVLKEEISKIQLGIDNAFNTVAPKKIEPKETKFPINPTGDKDLKWYQTEVDNIKKVGDLGSQRWLKAMIDLIKAETKAGIENGNNKKDLLEIEKDRITAAEEYAKRVQGFTADKSYNALTGSEQINKDMSMLPFDKTDISAAQEQSDMLNQIRLEKDLEYYETRRQLAEDAQITESEMLIAGYQSMTAGIEDMFVGFWNGIKLSEQEANNAMIRGFTTMANAFIAEVQRMAAQWLAFQAISGIFGIFGGNGIGAAVAKAARGHNGGEFLGTSNGIVKLASGGSFVVPSGFPNDSYPMLVESGERVTVTPANQTRQQDNAILSKLDRVANTIQALNLNVVSGSNPLPKKIELESTLQGNDIYMSNKKTTKKISRYS